MKPFASQTKHVAERRKVEVSEVLKFLAKLRYGDEGAKRVLDWAVFAQLAEIDNGDWVVPS